MWARVLAFLVWALVAAGAVAWGLKLFAAPLPLPPQAELAVVAPSAAGDWSRLFGRAVAPAEAPAPVAAQAGRERLQLLGVVASRSGQAGAPGVALISIDGKSPRALRVGAVVEGDQVLQAVLPRGVAIGPRGGPAMLRLELPAPPPATGAPGVARPSAAVPRTLLPPAPPQPTPAPASPMSDAQGMVAPTLPVQPRFRPPPMPGVAALPAGDTADAVEPAAEEVQAAPPPEVRALQR